MIVHRLLLLVLNLTVLKCASVQGDTEPVLESEIEDVTGGDSTANVTEGDTTAIEQSNAIVSTQDMFSRFLTVELFHMILQYVEKSRGKMSMVSKSLNSLADQTRIYRFYEGTYWDMPELANVWKFGEKANGHLEEFMDERNLITTLENVYSYEKDFDRTMKKLLNKESFKKLAYPVLKYLVRVCQKGDNFEANEIVNVAIRHKFYDLVYEMIMSNGYSLIFNELKLSGEAYYKSLLHEGFFFGYFSWAYKNNPSAFKHASEAINIVHRRDLATVFNDYFFQSKFVWIAFCIQKRVPETYYVTIYEPYPLAFFEAIQNFLYNSSMINLDPAEMEYNYNQTKILIDRYLRVDLISQDRVSFLELLNDIRFGPEDPGIYQTRVLPRTDLDAKMIRALIMTASKANKKNLVFELSSRPEFRIRDLVAKIELNNPHSFKVFFDILERMPLNNYLHGNFEQSLEMFIRMIFSNNLKIISITSMENVNKFEIETSSEYVELGFATAYEFILLKRSDNDHRIKEKMLNDFAESGADDFARLMTNSFGGPAMGVIGFHNCYSTPVSYEFIRLLLANEPLVWMLLNHNIRVHCEDNSLISEESITKFSPVINRTGRVWVNFE